jgi:hypothetical protein
VAIRTDWRIGKKGRACGGCSTPFPYDVPFHSAIFLEKEEFLRRDLCAACFAAAPSAPYSQWVAVIPKPEPNKRVFDLGLAAEFLRKLAGEGDPARGALAHLLALLLVRKRLVRLTDLPAKDGLPRARVEFHDGREPLEIPAPHLSEDDVPSLREELGRLLDLGRE